MKESTGPNHHTKILIVGAGIAGLTTALCLARNGYDLTMIEKSPALRDDGYMIDFFGSGYDVAERLGIIPDLERIHYPISRLAFLGADGGEKYSISYPAFRKVFDDRHFNFMLSKPVRSSPAERTSTAATEIVAGWLKPECFRGAQDSDDEQG